MSRLFCLILVVLLSGCASRSISDSGNDSGYTAYGGELSEFDVLGIERHQDIAESDIASALDDADQRLSARRGDRVLLVQSGATTPDFAFQSALSSWADVIAFSGIPTARPARRADSGTADESYARTLRLAAAHGGAKLIVVYWGVLETARDVYATKAISWVPIVGWALPDEKQTMRMRLRVAVIDTRSGRWNMITPAPLDSTAINAILTRHLSDQQQVREIKARAYPAAAAELARSLGVNS